MSILYILHIFFFHVPKILPKVILTHQYKIILWEEKSPHLYVSAKTRLFWILLDA